MRELTQRFILILMTAVLALSLCACDRGSSPEAAAPTATPSIDTSAVSAASDTDAAAALQSHIPPASGTDIQTAPEQPAPTAGGQDTAPSAGAQADATAYKNAQDCVGLTIFDLYAVVGKPIIDPVYTPSATQTGAQDGLLTYNGFTVTTLLSADGQELVCQVQPATEG